MIFEDEKNGFKAVLFFGGKKPEEFVGSLYYYEPEKKLQKKDPTKISEIKDMKQLISEIKGNWKENLIIGGKTYWSSDSVKPYKPIPIANPLSSDPRYREDLIWL